MFALLSAAEFHWAASTGTPVDGQKSSGGSRTIHFSAQILAIGQIIAAMGPARGASASDDQQTDTDKTPDTHSGSNLWYYIIGTASTVINTKSCVCSERIRNICGKVGG